MATKSIERLQSAWEKMAQEDPLWAVLSETDKRRGRWDWEQFLETGVQEMSEVMAYAASIMPDLRHDLALDFGCGVGRLTQAMSGHFDKIVGLDISASMIEFAKREDLSQGKCEYVLDNRTNLERFSDDTFDFIYSNITLQHMRPPISSAYIGAFVRVLRPGGLLIFQLPTKRRPGFKTMFRRFIPLAIRRKLMGGMEMHGIPTDKVESLLQDAGGRLLEAKPDDAAGRYWYGLRYAVTK
jgi:ubiquinone/menaquinone biosynthesis C-methylase UbiE